MLLSARHWGRTLTVSIASVAIALNSGNAAIASLRDAFSPSAATASQTRTRCPFGAIALQPFGHPTAGATPWVIAQTLTGAGASFANSQYLRYFSEYEKEKGDRIRYDLSSKSEVIKQLIAESIDFATSDELPKAEDKNQIQRGLLAVPTAGEAVAVIYNLEEAVDLRLSRETLAKIFSGQISNWKQVSSRLPNRDIRVVVWSDDSSTTYIFTHYLSAITNGRIKPSANPNWGFNVFARGSQNGGVAARVRQTEGTIGYVKDSYARQNRLITARIQNKAGNYIKPTLENVNKALSSMEFSNDFTPKNVNDPNNGYPIVGVTWLLIYKQYPEKETAQAIKDMVTWVLTKGQELNNKMDYLPIPQTVTQRAIQAVEKQVTVRP
jgi:phosphate transport system substrate-binding protein